MRLLPKDTKVGWTPYAWLVYLSGFLAEPFWFHRGAVAIAATLGVTIVFLALYFYGFWQMRHGRRLMAVAWAIVAIGVVCSRFSGSALCFFIYGASFLGCLRPPRRALLSVLAVVAVIGAVSVAFHMEPYFYVIAAVFSLIIGGANIHYSQVRDKDEKLLASQEEIERLAKVAERERIARDLHDLLGHTLSLIALKAELAGKLLERDPRRAAAEVKELERISRQALREVRSAVSGYRSQGFDAELARARLALESSGVRCEYFLAPLDLDPAQETALAFALREAVTNVVRHAGAQSCRIAVESDEEGVRLTVHDDGCGGASPDGVGLSAMRERIEGLGGHFERQTEQGTEIRIRLPRRALAADGVRGPARPEKAPDLALGV
jgi:two-component system sensor histidine kinase DesK